MSARDLIILGCASQHPTRYRNHGAYLLRWNEEGLLFDPGEGTQRQFIFAEIAPPCVNRIFISHFHGDHCLGLGSMLMRLNLDKVRRPIHCYYPASGKKFFDRLRYCCIYHETIQVVEHPVRQAGLVEDDGKFRIEAEFLDHGVDNIGWRIAEPDSIKFEREALRQQGIEGPNVRKLEEEGSLWIEGRRVSLEDVSYVRKGDVFAYVVDTRPCPAAYSLARGAKMLVCESTYLDEARQMAHDYRHMTAKQAAMIARDAGVETLILTHFSARYQDARVLEKEARSIFPNTFAAEDFRRFPFSKRMSAN